MMQQQTFDLPDNEERETIATALEFLRRKEYTEAIAFLVRRHDELTAAPKLKPYDPRESRV
jgi:hypothetical protein